MGARPRRSNMSRRDTIVLAVLINAGLLVVLFVSALKTDSGGDLAPINKLLVQEELVTSPETLAKIAVKAKEQIDISPDTPEKISVKSEEQSVIVKQQRSIDTPSNRSHVVTKGDYLEKIAKQHKVSIGEIIELNQLPNSRLQIGQELRISEPSQGKEPIIQKQEEEKYYIVKAGDNPWTIAIKNQMQVDELLELNRMDEAKAKHLRPGDRLRIQ